MYEVVDYYTDKGVLFTVDGEQEIGQVTEALLRAIAQPAR
jgi:adenylate kinase family enzyme